jgi:hypothetical protein
MMIRSLAKRLSLIGCGFVALTASYAAHAACGDTVDAPGKVFYVIPDGDLVAREVTLTVPACGEGKVAISSPGGWRAETEYFKGTDVNGRKVFVIAFVNPQGDDPTKVLAFKGSYIRGKNMAKYWGDMFKFTLPPQGLSQKDIAQMLLDEPVPHNLQHAGGFGFKAEVPAQEPQNPNPATFID